MLLLVHKHWVEVFFLRYFRVPCHSNNDVTQRSGQIYVCPGTLWETGESWIQQCMIHVMYTELSILVVEHFWNQCWCMIRVLRYKKWENRDILLQPCLWIWRQNGWAWVEYNETKKRNLCISDFQLILPSHIIKYVVCAYFLFPSLFCDFHFSSNGESVFFTDFFYSISSIFLISFQGLFQSNLCVSLHDR